MAEFEQKNKAWDYLFPESTLDAVTRPKIMFQRIQKRDGTIVDFDKSKIAKAIFAAAQSVGGKDREMAENLSDLVILYLARTYDDGLLNVEQIQDAVEKVLIENGHARTVKAYILYRDQRARIRRLQSGKPLLKKDFQITFPPIHAPSDLQVHTSEDELVSWNRERIVEALIREAQLEKEIAQHVAIEVETQIIYSKIQVVTVGLIRELVNAKLIEFGLLKEHRMHARLGLPVYDIEQLFFENSSQETTKPALIPSITDSTIVKDIYRQYALTKVFSSEIVTAHARGHIHLHDLDSITRLVRGTVPLEHLVKNGLHIPHRNTYWKPATDLSNLITQMIQLGSLWQDYFTDAVDWQDFNQYLSYFEENVSRETLTQEIHRFLLELNGLSHSTIHYFHLNFPKDSSPRIYDIASIFLTRYFQGDDLGRNYPVFIPVIHITPDLIQSDSFPKVLSHLSDGIKEKRPLLISFDRNPKLEFHYTVHKVTLNLCEAAIHANHNQEEFYVRLREQIRLASEAHLQKNAFIDHLFSIGKTGILSLLLEPLGESIREKNQVSRFATGITGLEQVVDIISPSPNLILEKKIEFAASLLEKIDSLIHQKNWKSGLDGYLVPTTDKQITQRLCKLTTDPEQKKNWSPGIDLSTKQDFSHLDYWKLLGRLHFSLNNRGLVYLKSEEFNLKIDSLQKILSDFLSQTEISGIMLQN